ncbi:hypothetical protein HG536_0D04350 [Torulaspora globosa]|uniref:Uncharacterized protein n=1 Tax=Torulaspora globosa TaxID=48254 RepID=A0A7G3ZHC7_9SACH|nr:uncharacterized protein HG536_0D04350 [Torulaspora globosa]QLL32913.1 hypothetical protein HG536_0D04350 [Torulaspora globosa]
MSSLQSESISDAAVTNDEVLEIFFDQAFVPQAFVDILLTNAAAHGLSDAQAVSSSLLSRLDYYTKHLTKELESTIKKLENLSEALPTAWATDDLIDSTDGSSLSRTNLGRPSKLEYYLDTLGSAVRAIDGDLTKIDTQMVEINDKYSGSREIAEKLRKLELIKGRLEKASQNFLTLQSFLGISVASDTSKDTDSQLTISVAELKLSLKTLEETIDQSLQDSLNKEGSEERNQELLDKIDLFISLKPLFKGLDNFHPAYAQFAQNIGTKAQNYLRAKDLGEKLTLQNR